MRPHGTKFRKKMIAKIQEFIERGKILIFIFFGYICVPVFDICAIDAVAMQNIKRLANVCSARIGCKHFANPGCAAAMRACDKNRLLHDLFRRSRADGIHFVIGRGAAIDPVIRVDIHFFDAVYPVKLNDQQVGITLRDQCVDLDLACIPRFGARAIFRYFCQSEPCGA